jgi:inosine-uridine nucleoside N-ribohydrolase
MSIPVLIDCDPGHDDAIALLLALASPELEVLGVTTVAGNSTLANTTANALTVLEIAGRADVPVAAGCDRPLLRPLRTAAHVHGPSGMEGPLLDPPTARAVEEHAVDFMAAAIDGSSRPITLLALGPLTNVALLLRRHPDVAAGIERVVVMGGSIGLGNTTPSAEFNMWVDPEAAAVVFDSGMDLTMVGLDVTHEARLGAAHGDLLRPSGRSGALVADLLDFFVRFHGRTYGMESSPIHDAVVVAHVVWPGLVATERLAVAVETASSLTVGRTVVDRWRVTDAEPNAHVAVGIDPDRFPELVVERLARLP